MHKHNHISENLFVCFNCGTETGHYLEFENNEGYENAPCPNCEEGKNTLPVYYLADMTITEFQRVMSAYAESTPWIPLLDYKFKSLQLPDVIVCNYKLSIAN